MQPTRNKAITNTPIRWGAAPISRNPDKDEQPHMNLSGPDDPARPPRWGVWVDRGRGWEKFARKGGPKSYGKGFRVTIGSDLHKRLQSLAKDEHTTVLEVIDMLEQFYRKGTK